MAANMQHMAGAGGMMPQQHRPRLSQVQLNQYLYQTMLAQQQPHSGWQAGVTIQERMIKCHNLITNIALAINSVDFMKAAEVGVNFEREAFNKAPDKATYEAQISNKTNDFFRRRQANEQNLTNNNLQAQAAAQAQQQLMMNQNSAMQNQMGRGIGQNPQQGFQHLQHQMQASQIPQQAQMGVNMGNQGGQPIGPNQQMFQMGGGQARPQNVPIDFASLTPADQQKVMELAQKMAANTHEQQKSQLRAMVQTRQAQKAQEFTAQGKDPVLVWFQHQALQGLQRNMTARQRMQQAGIPPNMNPAQAQAMMQAGRGQMNPAMQNAAGIQGGNGDFGQFNAMESIMNQQKAGILAQEQGQMVVPASNGPARNATPQPMTAGQGQGMPNPGGPNQTPRPPQAQQQLSMQAAQLKMEQQQSQHAAQMRAQQQARQLQGQPNGLGGAPPSQSPGMNTLNTPMRRPPSAMNPMEGQSGGQANGSFAGTLDPRFNQGNQRPMSTPGNMNLNNNPIYHTMMASFTDSQRQAVQALPPDKVHDIMAKWQEQRKMQLQAANNMQGRQFNMPNGGNPLMPNGMMPHQVQPGAVNQQIMSNQQQMLARLRNPTAPVQPGHQAMMDSMDMPPPVLAQIGSTLRAPPEIRKWKDLRQWLSQNPVNPQIQAQLEKVQRQQFIQYMQKSMEKRNQIQAQQQAAAQLHQAQQTQQAQAQQQMPHPQQPHQQQPQPPQQQQAQPQAQPLIQNGMQAGHAGPNQPPSGMVQGMPPNMPPNVPQHLLQVTQHEILSARKANPKVASLTDDQLRQFIIQIKQRQMATAMQKEMTMRQAQGGQTMQGQGSQNGPVSAPQQQQPSMGQPGGSQLNANVPTPAQASQPAQPKQPSATPDPKAAAPPRNNNRPAPNNQQQPPKPSPATAQKNLKRPSTDDAIDVPQTAPQQQPPRQIPNLTAEQIKNLTPAQKAGYEQLKSRQQQAMAAANAGGAAPGTDFEKLRRMGMEEQKLMASEPMPDIQMTPEQRQETAQKLIQIVVDMGKIGKALGRWYAFTHDDARAKSYFRARLRMIRQFADGENMANPKPVFSIRPAEIDEARRLLETMARDCAMLGKKAAAAAPPQQGGQAPTPTQSGATPAQGGQPAPLSAANLEKQTQALNKMHGRSNSKSGGPPAAPTTSQPPFSFGATSPHGQPAYIGKPKVNRENLTLPPRKKTKTDNTPPQPGQATPSPQISKSGSPELKRQEPPKPMFLCPEADCETSRSGFPSEQALHAHIQEDHVKPREDPVKFAQENLALALGLDTDGQVKMEPQVMAQPMAPNASKQGRTPASNAAATPMSRDVSMQRTGSKIGGKPQDNKVSVGKMEDTPKLEDKQPDIAAAAPAATIDPWANTVDPASLFTKMGGFEFGLDGTVSNMAVYRSLTPNDTPESSKDSGSSEPNSDISEGANLDIDMNWQPIDVDLLLDMNNINMDVADATTDSAEAFMLEDDMQMEQFTNWDEVSVDFTKPYQFDNSLYSLDVS